ncbi:3-methyladenine DNA glycosylase [Novipirellula galeiformis]|uniref:Putative 3-methyladenine DNA glycosylase n=2 Tax=Novipirellula galeiformis TaxID=2528004 RepID=A0A5C6CG54_9BACT|nr:3-methyladenine DNA glycosylase [Novipirellula galeiformis]
MGGLETGKIQRAAKARVLIVMKNLPLQKDRLTREFYARPTEIVARELLGKILLRCTNQQWVGGIIVETEAYLSDADPASHSARGKTKSNASMFMDAGTLYVYPIHAKYCMNAVTESPGRGSAVLIRAIQPQWGIAQMQSNRQTQILKRLTGGPAMLCQALAVDRGDDGIDLTSDRNIFIAHANPPSPAAEIHAAPRIGIRKAIHERLRFFYRGNPFVSGPKRDHQ